MERDILAQRNEDSRRAIKIRFPFEKEGCLNLCYSIYKTS